MFNSGWKICWGAGERVDKPIEQYNVLCKACAIEDALALTLNMKERKEQHVQLRIHKAFRRYVWWAPCDGKSIALYHAFIPCELLMCECAQRSRFLRSPSTKRTKRSMEVAGTERRIPRPRPMVGVVEAVVVVVVVVVAGVARTSTRTFTRRTLPSFRSH